MLVRRLNPWCGATRSRGISVSPVTYGSSLYKRGFGTLICPCVAVRSGLTPIQVGPSDSVNCPGAVAKERELPCTTTLLQTLAMSCA